MSKGHRPSEQRSELHRTELLRLDVFPKLIALKNILDQRRPDVPTVERLWGLLPQPTRAKIMDRRPLQRILQEQKQPRKELYKGANALFNQKQEKTLCRTRAERREQLFAMGIAGSGKRRSPGQGGSYKRNEKSRISC